jgi:hypothetical protein
MLEKGLTYVKTGKKQLGIFKIRKLVYKFSLTTKVQNLQNEVLKKSKRKSKY